MWYNRPKDYVIYFDTNASFCTLSSGYDTQALGKHIDLHKRISVFSRTNPHGMRITKEYLLIRSETWQNVSIILNIFKNDVAYWRHRFTTFSKEKYPEFFI